MWNFRYRDKIKIQIIFFAMRNKWILQLSNNRVLQ